jgi:hypothetical protein
MAVRLKQNRTAHTHTDYLLWGIFAPYLFQLMPPARDTPLDINIDTLLMRILVTQTVGLNHAVVCHTSSN